MARFSTRREQGFIWIPPDVFKPCRKVEVILADGSTIDITDDCISIDVQIANTDSLSTFNIVLSNYGDVIGKYTNKFTSTDEINIWFGYNNVFTKVFRGQIEKIDFGLDNSGHLVFISGQDYGNQLLNRYVNSLFTDREVSDIITNSTDGLIPSFSTGITTNNVEVTNTTITEIGFRQQKIFNTLRALSGKVDYLFYVDIDKDLNFFEKNSRKSTTEAAVASINIKSLKLGTDIKDIKNKILVTGKSYTDDVLILTSAQDTTSQESYGIREDIVNDTSIESTDEGDEKADIELNTGKDLLTKGNVTCLGMPTLKAGESIRISSPFDKVNAYYIPRKIQHKYDASGYISILTIEEIKISLITKLRDREINEKQIVNITNQNNMTDSYPIIFNTDDFIESFGNNELDNNGFLKLQSGFNDGTTVTINKTLTYSPTKCELRIDGEQLGASTIEVSFDNENNYQELSVKNLTDITNTGINMKIKFKLQRNSNNTEPIIRSASVLFKR